jgi:hypothetical protein
MTNEREEIIRDLESRKDTGRELEGFVPVRARIRPGPRAVVSIRLTSAELREIVAAAEVLERNTSEFIREAALKEARLARAGIKAARDAVVARHGGK